jgi:anti-sigma factor RsiW
VSRRERVRRSVDGELEPHELRALEDDAKRDPRLAKELEGARSVSRALAELERPEVPEDLVNASVLRAVQRRAEVERTTPFWKRWVAPRTVRVTPAAALAVLALLAVGAWALSERTGEIAADAAPRDAAVRLVLSAEGARSVAVAGDFNDWSTESLLLEDPEGDGVFATTLRLPPGSYAYMFVIDGERWVTDPYAVNHRDDGFGNRNAVLRID